MGSTSLAPHPPGSANDQDFPHRPHLKKKAPSLYCPFPYPEMYNPKTLKEKENQIKNTLAFLRLIAARKRRKGNVLIVCVSLSVLGDSHVTSSHLFKLLLRETPCSISSLAAKNLLARGRTVLVTI